MTRSRIWPTLIPAALLALCLGQAANAAPAVPADTICNPGDAAIAPVFHPLEKAMFGGDFEAFFDAAAKIGLGVDDGAQRDAAVEGLTRLMPDGFSHCRVILQRRDAGGLTQRITAFYGPGQRFPVYLYQVAVPDGNGLWVSRFNIQTTLSKISAQVF